MFQKTNDKLMLNDKSYTVGKKLVQVYIPAVSTLYFGISAIWGLPDTEQIMGTLAVIATFLGVCLGLSSKQYEASDAAHDGKAVVTTNLETGKKLFSLELNDDPRELDQKDSISFKVVTQDEQEDTSLDPPQSPKAPKQTKPKGPKPPKPPT